MIYVIFLIKHKIQQTMIKKTLLHNLKNYLTVLKVPKNLKSKEHKLMFK